MVNDDDFKAWQAELDSDLARAEEVLNRNTEKICSVLREMLDLIRSEQRPKRNNRP